MTPQTHALLVAFARVAIVIGVILLLVDLIPPAVRLVRRWLTSDSDRQDPPMNGTTSGRFPTMATSRMAAPRVQIPELDRRPAAEAKRERRRARNLDHKAWGGLLALTLVIVAGVLAACSDAAGPGKVDQSIPAPVTPPSLSVSPASSAGPDSLRYTLIWGLSQDALGPATSYQVVVCDSASGAQVASVTVTDTTAAVVVPMPAFDSISVFRLTVQAERRGRLSAPASGYLRVIRIDFDPPVPIFFGDTLPIILVGATVDCERTTVAGPLLDVRGDSLFLVPPAILDLPQFRYCVASRYVVVLEGTDAVITPGDSIPISVYQPGAPLPRRSQAVFRAL